MEEYDSKSPKDYTVDDIETINNEIKHYYSKRKLFLGLAFACFGLAIVFVIIGVFSGIQAFVTLTALAFCGMIVLFVLRGALFNRRIKARKLLLKEAKMYKEFRE